MATLRKGILGPISGKMGGNVYSSNKGIQVQKALPKKSRKAITPGQLAGQAKFSFINKFVCRLKELIEIGYRPRSKKEKPARAVAFKYHYDHAILGEYPNYAYLSHL